ncbi:uncharacterized protein [Dendrobates tinctorius]|uniref:uncharacterized protein isoform X2 n=1 Tax=Dendrobates tinctorius TaxID=92724 RepID=UPI003CC9EC67
MRPCSSFFQSQMLQSSVHGASVQGAGSSYRASCGDLLQKTGEDGSLQRRLVMRKLIMGSGQEEENKEDDSRDDVIYKDGKIPDGRYFIIKETVCLRSEDADLSQCDFKPDGDVKFCALDLGDDGSTEIQCISQNKVVRVRRSGKKKKCNNIICKLFPSGSTSVIAGGSNPGRGVVA